MNAYVVRIQKKMTSISVYYKDKGTSKKESEEERQEEDRQGGPPPPRSSLSDSAATANGFYNQRLGSSQIHF